MACFTKVENEKIISHLSGLVKSVTKTETGCLNCHICSMRFKGVLVKNEKYGTLSINDVTQTRGGGCTFVAININN